MYETLPNRDVSYLDSLLLENGLYRVPTTQMLDALNREDVRVWCHYRGFYLLPTVELVEWVAGRIGTMSAIEIGSGNGALGRALGIPLTDSRAQEDPKVKALYTALQQPVIKYPADVEKLDAVAAVRKYRPDVVVATWVTQWGKDENTPQSSMFGVNEALMLSNIHEYIFIGSETQHNQKKIRNRPHKVFKFPFIRSRTQDHNKNVIYIFSGKASRSRCNEA